MEWIHQSSFDLFVFYLTNTDKGIMMYHAYWPKWIKHKKKTQWKPTKRWYTGIEQSCCCSDNKWGKTCHRQICQVVPALHSAANCWNPFPLIPCHKLHQKGSATSTPHNKTVSQQSRRGQAAHFHLFSSYSDIFQAGIFLKVPCSITVVIFKNTSYTQAWGGCLDFSVTKERGLYCWSL